MVFFSSGVGWGGVGCTLPYLIVLYIPIPNMPSTCALSFSCHRRTRTTDIVTAKVREKVDICTGASDVSKYLKKWVP